MRPGLTNLAAGHRHCLTIQTTKYLKGAERQPVVVFPFGDTVSGGAVEGVVVRLPSLRL